MSSVFLSYARSDTPVARQVAALLTEAGHNVWWDQRLRGGSQFSKEIEHALDQARAVVVLWSKTANDSPWVRDEAAAARDTSRLVPVSIDGVLPPLGFRQFHVLRWEKGVEPALLAAVGEMAGSSGPIEPLPPHRARLVTRRTAIAGVAVAGIGASAAWLLRRGEKSASPEVQALLAQAWTAWTQGSADGNAEAIGLYRRATELDPGYADSWGFLGCAYGDRGHAWANRTERTALWERARDAARQALQLDAKNAYGRAADAYARPSQGNWKLMESAFRQALSDQPGKWLITYSLGILLMQVGRLNDAIGFFSQLKGSAPTATQYFFHVNALWGAGQLAAAESLLDEASAIFGGHPMIWTTRFELVLYGGQPGSAMAMVDDVQKLPTRFGEGDIRALRTLADAMTNGGESRIEAAAAEQLARSHVNVISAIEAIKHLSGLGRMDDAFAVANAVYFSRGFAVPDFAATPGPPQTVKLDDRETRSLFFAPAKAMRSDARFGKLVADLGLAGYWRAAGVKPDYEGSSPNRPPAS